MVLNQSFREFIECLDARQVLYLVVGGYAVAFHGHPRYTKDLDIWIQREPENATRLMQALDDFGFGQVGLRSEDFLTEDQIIQLGYPPNRIDLLTSVPGVDFEECHRVRTEVLIDGLKISFIDLDNLKKAKLASGRYQDLADLESLG